MIFERSKRVFLVLAIVMASTLTTTGIMSSSDRSNISKLEPKTPSCSFRTIASEEAKDSAQVVCENERKINSLKQDLDEINQKKADIFKTLEKLEDEEERANARTNKDENSISEQNLLLMTMMMNRWSPSAPQPIPYAGQQITYAYSPFHNSSRESNMAYLQMAMSHRLKFQMDESNYWQPEWDRNGNMLNPVYGGPNASSMIRDMYRAPLGQSQFYWGTGY